MKITGEHIFPVSRQAIATVDEIKPLTGPYGLVFPNRNDVTRVMSENTLLYAMYRMGYHQHATVHGFRASASTILNEIELSSVSGGNGSTTNHPTVERIRHGSRYA